MSDTSDIPPINDVFGRLLSRVDRALARIEDICNLVAGLLIFALMVLGVVQIVMRTLFSSPIFGYIDVVEIAMVGFAVLSIAYVQRLGGHVRMELVLARMRGRLLWFVESLASLIAIAIVAILIPASFEHFYRAFDIGDSTIDIELVTWPAKLVVPIALFFLLLRLLLQLFGYVRLVFDPELAQVAIPILKDSQMLAAEEIAATKDGMLDADRTDSR